MAEVLRQGRQALVLLPEIALTQQIVERFAAPLRRASRAMAFGPQPEGAAAVPTAGSCPGEARIIAGARSSLYLPFPDLGLIVVDEEHDTSFKQEDGLHYHARDMAVLRGSVSGFPVVLVSATPSLETVRNAREGRYRHLKLTRRYGSAGMPEIDLLDLRADRPPSGHAGLHQRWNAQSTRR